MLRGEKRGQKCKTWDATILLTLSCSCVYYSYQQFTDFTPIFGNLLIDSHQSLPLPTPLLHPRLQYHHLHLNLQRIRHPHHQWCVRSSFARRGTEHSCDRTKEDNSHCPHSLRHIGCGNTIGPLTRPISRRERAVNPFQDWLNIG